MTHHFGIHAVDSGGIDMAARRSAAAGGTALQIFTAIPKYYGDKISDPPRAGRAVPRGAGRDRDRAGARDRARRLRAQHRERRRGKVEPRGGGLAKELERSTALGVGGVCFHPGAATDGDRAAAAGRVAARDHAGARDGGRRHADPGREHGRAPARPSGGRRTRSAPSCGACPTRSARAHRLRARHLPPLLGRTRHHRVAGTRSPASSTSSRPRPASRRRSSISTTAKARWAPTRTATC